METSKRIPRRERMIPFIKYWISPILLGIYPVLFHYANNLDTAAFSSATMLLGVSLVIASGLYFWFYLTGRYQALKAANAAFVFLLYFHTYGIAFDGLRTLDVIRVEHYTLLPMWVLLGFYVAGLAKTLSEKRAELFWRGTIVVIGGLVAFNIIRIGTDVAKRPVVEAPAPPSNTVVSAGMEGASSWPDIYYIVFDEMAAFGAMREYWHYDGVDSFVEFLEEKGFYVAENSRGSSVDTLHQLAIRLNFVEYEIDDADRFREAVTSNRVLEFLQLRGYRTVAYDERRATFAYPGSPPMRVDYLYEPSSDTVGFDRILIDDFASMVMRNSMLGSLSDSGALHPTYVNHVKMIQLTVDKIGEFGSDGVPQFVYVHLMLPHMPFIFDANGHYNPRGHHHNWEMYLGQYIYTLRVAKEMVENILESADSEHPAVIILQSDHGARNKPAGSGKILENYPEEYGTWIVNAVHLPGCKDAPLNQEMDPINTFPIVFNCYFDANIPLN